MNQKQSEEFRKGFILRDTSNDPRTPLDDMYDSVGTIQLGAKPLTFGGGSCGAGCCNNGNFGFYVDMSKCKWK